MGNKLRVQYYTLVLADDTGGLLDMKSRQIYAEDHLNL